MDANIVPSGKAEEGSDTDILLDDVILEIDENEEERSVKNETVKEMEHHIIDSGNNIRDLVVSCGGVWRKSW